MNNSNNESAGGVSIAAEFLRKSTEDAVNAAMEDSFESFLEDCVSGDASPRNGYYERTALTMVGPINVRVPRDRLNLFEERVIGKYRRRIDDFDAEVCRLYAQGLTCSDIAQYIEAETGSRVSERLVLAIVQGSYGQAEKFNSAKLPECPIVYIDGTWLPVRRHYDGGDHYEKECVMIALGITKAGQKRVLGFWITPGESSTKWADCLKDIKGRGVGSPLLFVTDGLQGMPEAIKQVFPGAIQQRCLVHVGGTCPRVQGRRTGRRYLTTLGRSTPRGPRRRPEPASASSSANGARPTRRSGNTSAWTGFSPSTNSLPR
jgi:putative transposase